MRRTSWLAGTPPTVAIEVARERVTVVDLAPPGQGLEVRAAASESLPDGAVLPALSGQNITDRDAAVGALSRALQRAGLSATRRAALVVPDSVARVSLVPLTEVPSRGPDLDEVIRWQVRKATPFPLEDAQLTYFEANRSAEGTTFAVVVARRSVVAEYEALASALGIHAGTVDLASFNLMNAVMAVGADTAEDALLVHVTAEATTIAILRGRSLMFYRHRTAMDEEPLSALVHQTAMYHEDRLGGGRFARVWLCGSAASGDARRQIAERLGIEVHPVDVRAAVRLADGAGTTSDWLDAVAAPVGILLRDRTAA